MSHAPELEFVEAARGHVPAVETGTAIDSEKPPAAKGDVAETRESVDESLAGPAGVTYPTEEEVATLRRVHGKVDWLIYSIGVVELVERFAYYGTAAVCKSAPRPLTSS